MTDTHLGGYLSGGDPATFFPHLWHWLAEAPEGPQIRSVLDIGCGEGQALSFFRDQLNLSVTGVEGVPQKDRDIQCHDFTKGPWYPEKAYDMVWSSEFLEHVDEKYLMNLNPAFSSAPLILITHAFPGQLGTHHVNCRWPDYWIGYFAGLGYLLDHALTARAREIAGHNHSPQNHFCRSGLVFVRDVGGAHTSHNGQRI